MNTAQQLPKTFPTAKLVDIRHLPLKTTAINTAQELLTKTFPTAKLVDIRRSCDQHIKTYTLPDNLGTLIFTETDFGSHHKLVLSWQPLGHTCTFSHSLLNFGTGLILTMAAHTGPTAASPLLGSRTIEGPATQLPNVLRYFFIIAKMGNQFNPSIGNLWQFATSATRLAQKAFQATRGRTTTKASAARDASPRRSHKAQLSYLLN